MRTLIPLGTVEDAALVRGVRAGDPRAADAVVRRHRAALVRYAARLLGGRDVDAEDVVQEALMRGLRHLERTQQPVELRPWLHRIVRNACFDLVRATRAPAVTLGHADVPALSGDPHLTVTSREAVREALGDLAELPEHQRVALENRAFGGVSHAETARQLDVSPMASKMLVHRGRATLLRRRSDRSRMAA